MIVYITATAFIPALARRLRSDLETLMRAALGALASFNEDERMILTRCAERHCGQRPPSCTGAEQTKGLCRLVMALPAWFQHGPAGLLSGCMLEQVSALKCIPPPACRPVHSARHLKQCGGQWCSLPSHFTQPLAPPPPCNRAMQAVPT